MRKRNTYHVNLSFNPPQKQGNHHPTIFSIPTLKPRSWGFPRGCYRGGMRRTPLYTSRSYKLQINNHHRRCHKETNYNKNLYHREKNHHRRYKNRIIEDIKTKNLYHREKNHHRRYKNRIIEDIKKQKPSIQRKNKNLRQILTMKKSLGLKRNSRYFQKQFICTVYLNKEYPHQIQWVNTLCKKIYNCIFVMTGDSSCISHIRY